MSIDVRGYKIVLSEERDGDDVSWVAEVPELPGCYCAEDTPEEVIAHVEQSISDWLNAAAENGRPIPSPVSSSSGKFTIRLPRWVHRELKVQADLEGMSLNAYASHILTYWVGHRALPAPSALKLRWTGIVSLRIPPTPVLPLAVLQGELSSPTSPIFDLYNREMEEQRVEQ